MQVKNKIHFLTFSLMKNNKIDCIFWIETEYMWDLWLSGNKYRKVASNWLSRFVAHPRIFRLFMKRNFDAYILWPLDKKAQNWISSRPVYFSRLYSIFQTSVRGLPLIWITMVVFYKFCLELMMFLILNS